MLINQTLDQLDGLGLFGMALGLREQLEQSQYLSLSFDERLGLLVDRETEARDGRRLARRSPRPSCASRRPWKTSIFARRVDSTVP